VARSNFNSLGADMKRIIIILFIPCVLFAQNTRPPDQNNMGGNQSNNGSFFDPNARLRSAAENNADKCPFLSTDTVPGDSELRSLLQTTVASLKSQVANSPACSSVGTYISQIYMSLYGVPLSDTALSDVNDPEQRENNKPKPTRSGGCLNASSKRIDPVTGVDADPDCARLLDQLQQLQMQLQSCNLKDKSVIAANIGQLTVGAGMILGGNAAEIVAGSLIQIGSALVKYIAPTKLDKAAQTIAKINKVEADTLLENAMSCYLLSMYQGIYCKKDFVYKKKYENILIQALPTVRRGLKRNIQEQQDRIEQLRSDYRFAGYSIKEQSKHLINYCYNGYIFLNYDVKDGSINLEDEPKPFFRKNCLPLTECVSKINTRKLKGWNHLPVLFTKGHQFNFLESCGVLKEAQLLAQKNTSENISSSLEEDKFNGKTCSTRGPVIEQNIKHTATDDEDLSLPAS